MRINYNVSAMLANNTLSNNDNLLGKSLQKLSSGLKINAAKDNPAGLAMAKRMNAQIEGLSMAGQNANDGVSVIEIADGAMNEVQTMMQRMTELATKAANGTMTDSDREVVQDEIDQLKEEITRISKTTEFNGQPLLDGSYEMKGYAYSIPAGYTGDPSTLTDTDISVAYYSEEVSTGYYQIDSLKLVKDSEGIVTASFTSASGDFPGVVPDDYSVSMVDDQVSIKGKDGFEIRLTMPVDAKDMSVGSVVYSDIMFQATGLGPMRLQIGANENQVMSLNIPAVSLSNMQLAGMDVSTEEGAQDALTRLSRATTFVNEVRGRLGAYQNRLESTVNSLDITNENMTSAYSRIMDVDMAEEMTQYSTYTVLTQAGTSVLAQANDRPSQVLQLLQ